MMDRGFKEQNIVRRTALIVILVLLTGILMGCAADKKDIIENVDQLNQKNYTISVHPGSAAATIAEARFPNANIVYSNAITDAYLAVQQGKSDAVVYGKIFMQYAAASESLDDLALMDEILDQTDDAVGINPKREDLLPKVNAFIAQIKADGTLDDMYNRWIVQADTTMPDIPQPTAPSMTLKIGTSGLVEPMNYFDENQELTGLDVEFIYRLAAYLNADVQLEAMSFEALVASLESGKLDAVVSDLNVTEERKQVILMSDPYMVTETAVMVRADRLNQAKGSAAGENGSEGFLGELKNSFQRTFITENRWKLVVSGLKVTVFLSLASLILGSMLGFVVSFPLRSKNRMVRSIAGGISTVLDGMPLVVILMVLYYIIFRTVDISAVWVGVIGFSLDFANTVAGLLNTGVGAVDPGQLEAADSMGYNKREVFCKITFPQVAHHMFAQYEGAVVGLVKGTAIIGYITVEDLTKAGDIIRSRTYEAFFPLIATAVLYFIIASLFIFVLKRVSVGLDPKSRPRTVKGVEIHD